MALQAPPRALLLSGFQPFILEFFFRLVLVLRATPGVLLTSWFRTVQANISEGGDEDSQHLFGLAADFEVPRVALGHVLEVARGVGLIPVNEGDHVHVQLFQAGALARAGVVFPR